MSLKYKVTVDGTAYTVEVEELGSGAPIAVAQAAVAPIAAASVVSAPTPTAATHAPAPATPVAEGATTIEAPMPGKILDVKVAVGASVKSGDLVIMLEAMKMENEIYATSSGAVKEVRVRSGDSVNTGDVLIVIG